jgi:type II secretory pathway pseudopilin PulG
MRTVVEQDKNVVNKVVVCGRYSSLPAFTLVELLVVIGIIALLISVLMPALSKARQQANLIDCESRLRQMGQALNIYSSENNGLLPLADVKYDPTGAFGSIEATTWLAGTTPQSAETSWYWDFTLSQLIQPSILGSDHLVHNLSAIFHDVDTIDVPYTRYANHYTCNPVIFPVNYEPETIGDTDSGGNLLTVDGSMVKNRKFSNIKPSTSFLFWDAPQCADWASGNPNVAYEQATEIDGNRLTFGSGLFRNMPNGGQYNRPATPGSDSQSTIASVCAAFQKKDNRDLQAGQGFFTTHMRFRHMNNTVLNALCVDGHVENRSVGTFMVLDICIMPPG